MAFLQMQWCSQDFSEEEHMRGKRLPPGFAGNPGAAAPPQDAGGFKNCIPKINEKLRNLSEIEQKIVTLVEFFIQIWPKILTIKKYAFRWLGYGCGAPETNEFIKNSDEKSMET